ncbi:BolA family protein [Aliiruegeria lutimaris]|uniref:BolA protein n=1 Tax=Aliiruegeria lutimaris TaxID=571298 RepID=A0A1G9NLX7_9RHOB|nr:BolA family protein [Aliiruegeria lutimaris]SDL87612.1 BolA protein [Aliiruegeria lutimaris]
MSVAEEIERKLTEAFSPSEIEVIDESENHRGHAGYREEGESHFHVRLRAPAFADMSRISRHRAVHAALGAELVGRIHALALDLAP